MRRPTVEWLRAARDHARAALDDGGGLSAEALAAAKQPLHAVLYDLVVVGEALGKVPIEVRGLAPAIPWRAITDMRNLIVHAYWQIDEEIVAEVLERDLEPLISALDGLIAALAGKDA
jgi:uncharacterized protein with HEPN domain